MTNKLKLIRECIYDFLDANIEKLRGNKDFKKFGVYVGVIGTATLVGSIAIASTSPKLGVSKSEVAPSYDFATSIHEENSKQEIMDFENYDLTSLDRFCNDIGSLYYTDDALNYRAKYGDIVEEKANKWGVDPNLAMAILTQESRGADTNNIMQIGFGVWQGEPFRVYDFENDKYVDILLTNDPVLYNSDKYLTINQEDLKNPSTNISIGNAMLQYSFRCMDYDIPAGSQCYNYGPTAMNNKVFAEAYTNTFRTKDDLLHDQYDFSFMNYTYAYDKGDNDYFYHISRFFNPEKETITVKEKDINGVTVLHEFEYQKLIDEYHQYRGQIL